MKAIIYKRYGGPDVLEISELPKPEPKSDELLVRIHATSVTSGDVRARGLDMPSGYGLIGRLIFGIFGPRKKVLGTEFAGIVEAAGEKVTRFKPGDEVIAYPGGGFGGYAEYAALMETSAIALKPRNADFTEAVAISFGGSTALDFLEAKGGIRSGEHVLISGASGGVGSAAVQLAKHFGAHVTAVCSAGNFEMVRELGADEVIDYKNEDFTVSGKTWDIIMDTTGTLFWRNCEASLNEGGRMLMVSASLWSTLAAILAIKTKDRKAIPGYSAESAATLRRLVSLYEQGQFRPFIDRVFHFGEIRQAHALADTGRKRGNVVIDTTMR